MFYKVQIFNKFRLINIIILIRKDSVIKLLKIDVKPLLIYDDTFSEMIFGEMIFGEIIFVKLIFSEIIFVELIFGEIIFGELNFGEILAYHILIVP